MLMPIPIIECSVVPNITASLGSTGKKSLLSAINTSWGGSGVLFGSDIDPLGDRYRTFLSRVVAPAVSDSIAVTAVHDACTDTSDFRPIVCENDLRNIPPSMHVPIMTHPVMRRLLGEDRISGFGLAPWDLPEEDIVGRLLSNGRIENIDPKGPPVVFEHVWRTGDPTYDGDALEAIEATREFIVNDWLEHELPKGTRGLDPTDYNTGSNIGTVK